MPIGNYVKFLRATPTAFGNLSRKEPGTLYFVFEDGAKYGSLYLGETLIAAEGSFEASLSSLQDVKLESLVDGSILVYDEYEEKWVNKEVSEIFNLIVETMKGATETEDGTAGLVPAPKSNERVLFLRGDGSWATPVAEIPLETQQAITTLQSEVGVLIGADNNLSVREIAVNVLAEQLIPENAVESLDTLEEISAWIQSHPADAAAMNREIGSLKTSVGILETSVSTLNTNIGTIENSLNTLTSTVELINGSVGSLESQIIALQEADEDLAADVRALQEAMKWQELELN